MKVRWNGLMAGVGAAAGALLLGATVLVSTVGAQAPSPGAMPGTPPNRVYGTVQLNGQPAPAGTTVTATVGMATCGTAQVSSTGTYVIDVASAASQPGCGTDGATVSFSVGGARATQTTMWRQGAFTELNLTAQSATPTPARTPAPATATPRPPTATPRPPATPTARPATPSPTARPAVSPTARPQGPVGPAQPQRPAAAPPAAARPAGAQPAALPRTGTGVAADTAATTGLALGGLALAVLALGATGLLAYRRSR